MANGNSSTALVVRKRQRGERGATNAYPRELRDKLVKLAMGGADVKELAAKYQPSVAAIRSWVVEAQGGQPLWQRQKERKRQLRLRQSQEAAVSISPTALQELQEERDYLKR